MPDKMKIFLSHTKDVSFGYREIVFFKVNNLEEEQVGYSVDAEGRSLVTGKDGDWKENWVVIATDDLGDPIIIDISNPALQILTAPHGEGNWESGVIADSLDNFERVISLLNKLSKKREDPVGLEKHPLKQKERQAVLKQIKKENPKSDLTYWEAFLDED